MRFLASPASQFYVFAFLQVGVNLVIFAWMRIADTRFSRLEAGSP